MKNYRRFLYAKNFQSREHTPKHDFGDFYTTIHFTQGIDVNIQLLKGAARHCQKLGRCRSFESEINAGNLLMK